MGDLCEQTVQEQGYPPPVLQFSPSAVFP